MKDLNYWKKKLLEIMEGQISKSLEDILFPQILLKAIPLNTQMLLIKARGFAPGTIREWRGKKYKKLSSGKWALAYEGTGSKGEQQATRNVMAKIQKADSMQDLLNILRENSERFKTPEGKTLPVIKEFLIAARATEPGKKKISTQSNAELKDESNSTNTVGNFRNKTVELLNASSLNNDDKKEAIDDLTDEKIKLYMNLGMTPESIVMDTRSKPLDKDRIQMEIAEMGLEALKNATPIEERTILTQNVTKTMGWTDEEFNNAIKGYDKSDQTRMKMDRSERLRDAEKERSKTPEKKNKEKLIERGSDLARHEKMHGDAAMLKPKNLQIHDITSANVENKIKELKISPTGRMFEELKKQHKEKPFNTKELLKDLDALTEYKASLSGNNWDNMNRNISIANAKKNIVAKYIIAKGKN
jgi:hypothetical protein